MKTIKRTLLVASMLLLGLGTVNAQDFQTGYFLGGYQYAYRMNPAFQNAHNFVAVGLGNTGINAQSTMGFKDFFYVKDGKTCLFLNDKVSSQEFLKNFTKNGNNISAGVNLSILATGFWAGGNYFTVDLGLKSVNSASVPYDVFRFLKDGSSNGNTFSFSNLSARSKNYVELAVGWSRNWNNFIIGGARVKSLVGIAEAEASFDRIDLALDRNQWKMVSKGHMYLSSPAASASLNEDGSYNYQSIKFNAAKAGPAGYGAAVDLGVIVNVFPWLTASLSVLDFGIMSWTRNIAGATNDNVITWDKNSIGTIDPFKGGQSEASSKYIEQLKEFGQMVITTFPTGASTKKVEMLPFRWNIGVEGRLPMYDRLSMGVLWSFRHGTGFNWNEGRLSVNWNPLNFIGLSASTAINTFFQSFGAALSLHPGVFNIFFGGDFIPGKVVPLNQISQDAKGLPSFVGIPSTSNLNVNVYMGISVAFGKRKVDYMRRSIEY